MKVGKSTKLKKKSIDFMNAVNQPLLPVSLQIANRLLETYQKEKQDIQHKYRECDYFKEGIEYKSQLSRIIGHIEAIESFITQIKELLK